MSAVVMPPLPPATVPLPALVTADEFLRLHGDESGVELVNGRTVRLSMPGAQHGEVCVNAAVILHAYVKRNKLGRVMGNDTFVVTRTNPAAVRGADVLYISYRTLPAGVPTPVGAITPPLELVVEVRSPSDSPADLAAKAAEYLAAGVMVVLLLDPETDTATVCRRNKPDQPFGPADTLTLPDVLPGFAVAVAEFFA